MAPPSRVLIFFRPSTPKRRSTSGVIWGSDYLAPFRLLGIRAGRIPDSLQLGDASLIGIVEIGETVLDRLIQA